MPGRKAELEGKGQGNATALTKFRAQSCFFWETTLYKRHLCISGKSSINTLHINGTVSGELLVLLSQQETEKEQQQKGRGPTCQGVQDFLFPDSVEVTRLGSGGLFDLKLLGVHLVRHRFAPIRRKLSWCPWWISLECLLYARHYIQLMRLPMRMFLRNPCKHNP